MTVELFGYKISNQGLEADVSSAFQLMREGESANFMACANPHSLVVANKDDKFQKALKRASLLIPDGFGIVIAAKILRLQLLCRVTGFDFFLHFNTLAERSGAIRYFFLGSSEQVLSLIVARLNREFPSINVCGTYSPAYKDVFMDKDKIAMMDAINSAKPDVLWVGMTAPKQERWIYENLPNLKVPFIAAIGAAFDYYAGSKKRCSIFWQKLGLEWLVRFLREPGRLWERNLKSTPIFLGWILKGNIKRVIKFGDRSE